LIAQSPPAPPPFPDGFSRLSFFFQALNFRTLDPKIAVNQWQDKTQSSTKGNNQAWKAADNNLGSSSETDQSANSLTLIRFCHQISSLPYGIIVALVETVDGFL